MTKKYVRIIDEDGFHLEDSLVEDLTKYTIETPCPPGFYHPKWDFDNKEWVEGGTKPEPQPHVPTTEEELEALKIRQQSTERALLDIMLFL